MRVRSQPGGECAAAEIGLIPGGYDVTERDVLLIGQVRQKERGRSALRHEGDAILARRGRYRGGPRHRLCDEVHEAQAVRAEEPDSRCGGAVGELLLQGLTLRADFGEARREDHRRPRTCDSEIRDDLNHGIGWDQDDAEIDLGANCGAALRHPAATDASAPWVDQVELTGVTVTFQVADDGRRPAGAF